ncbi:MAG: FAD-binding oxidoreductase [Alphaproteobacteria bacterium]|nr:FAD-binding oxidoreductase [Alphaproteobacteria bacterium]
MSIKKLKYWGWGNTDEGLTNKESDLLLGTFAKKFGILPKNKVKVPKLDDIKLPTTQINLPKSLRSICKDDPLERVLHSFGQSQPDSIRIFAADFDHAPDVIAYPENEEDISAIFDWAGESKIAVIPYGGGSSVVGGVTPDVSDYYTGTIVIDLSKFNRVKEVDEVSRAALIQGGTRGPDLERQLKPHGLTLRHFPQSFEHSTLGGWIATRSGGHFATLYTHIDDLVENITTVAPSGSIISRRLPGSGAGPSPDSFIMGSEGSLGIITEAWVRLQGRPKYKSTAGFKFTNFFDAARAVRAVSQAGLYPSNLRIVDQTELLVNGAGDGTFSLMVVSFESSDHPVESWMHRAEECCLDNGGILDVDWRSNDQANMEGAVGAWRNAFIRMPYNREELTPRGIISDTFETAITWDKFEEFYYAIKEATSSAVKEATGKSGVVSCRFSHAYPDGPAPYFAFHGEAFKDGILEQWQIIKNVASEAIIKNGGTITHHHAIGRDHRKWYNRQRPKLFGEILNEAKNHLDPENIMNPGVIT